jgi:hypothetical protein
MAQVLPFQSSANASPFVWPVFSDEPTAIHAVPDVQETPDKLSIRPLGLGLV